MSYRRGDLALVPFPFTDLSSAKQRPVLVLADPDGYGDFLAVAVTSRPHHSNAIAIRDQDISHGALPATSWVRTDRVVTLNVVLVSKVFGSASSLFVDRVIRGVCSRVGINAAPDAPGKGA
ncbi:type II toxin-antitoxin system PemK/MazF family toxin [uncultured Thiodictyon sp.]|uniref:type II toxin-antitoxin system PemK/MazF family toxin n=1 Tax=uncultured Thiodictyon sp. TaxID=1846217 RepID=UPI0025E86914|nr:type II toxin-antitoxin system PemK/MazF family toxin [uncultured Thiodictyon sp.]